MNLKIVPNFCVLATILFNSISVSLAVIGIHSKEIGARLCVEQFDKNYNCALQLTYQMFIDMMVYNGFPNITTPHVRFFSSGGVFNIKLPNGRILVQAFFKVEEGMGVDIELMNTSSDDVFISCLSFGSPSKLSTNIFKSSVSLKTVRNLYQVDEWPTNLDSHYFWNVPEREIQSGHFTCRSMDELYYDYAETIRIFTQPSPIVGLSPFVSIRESTIQIDDSGDGYIVPCRTNYRLETPPHLLWKTQAKDDFTVVTAEQMKSFVWNPSVGFQFNRSNRMWEIETLACRLDSYEKVFLPTPSEFSNMYTVKLEGTVASCVFAARNESKRLGLKSKLNFIQTILHICLTDELCDLEWELDDTEESLPYRKIVDKPTRSLLVYSGLLACSFEHVYKGNRVPETSYRKYFTGLDSELYLLPGFYPTSSVIQINELDGPLYKSDTEFNYEFTCTIVDFVRITTNVNLMLRHKDKNETFSQRNIMHQAGSASTVRFNVTLHANITEAICSVLITNGSFVSAARLLQIIDASAPVEEPLETNKRTLKVGDLSDNHTLMCPITGVPTPTYQWIMDEKFTKLVQGVNTRNLTFRQIHENIAGSYTCQAQNKYGNSSFQFHVSVLSQGFFSTLSPTTILWTGLGTFFGFIGLCAAMIFALKYFRAKRQMRNLTSEEAAEFLNGVPVSVAALHVDEGSEVALKLPFTKRIESRGLVIARDSILGRGQYGVVYRGILDAQAVAVKTFKRTVTYDEFRAALVEVKLMSFVGEHDNIVRFIGADVSNIEKRDILIVMELSPIGSLEKHLKIIKPSTPTNYVNTTPHYASVEGILLVEKLFGFCEQIAFAMEYLESKKVIHGDLAARNILVFNHGVVKVTDFGYSRQLYDNSMYKAKKNRALPWRSAAVELLRQMEFSTETDIWAFGVTVWEISTFGSVPFASHRYSDEFVDSLVNGLRLQRPSGLSESQYSFLKECWNLEKMERPRFSVLKSFFSMEKQNLRHHFENTV